VNLEIKRLPHCFSLPTRATPAASGLDLYFPNVHPVSIGKGCRYLCPTGIAVAVPDGYEGQIRPRSGLAATSGITVINSPGTIDSDYRGEVFVALLNTSMGAFTLRPGHRFAQLVICPVVRPQLVEVDALDNSERGDGGFGSTGD